MRPVCGCSFLKKIARAGPVGEIEISHMGQI